MPNTAADTPYAAHRGKIAFIDVPDELQHSLTDALNGGYAYRSFESQESLLTALGIGNGALDALIIGRDMKDPLDLALAARRQARHLQIIVLADARNVDSLSRRAEIQAASGDEIVIWPALDTSGLPDRIRRAIKRAHRRVRADLADNAEAGAAATATEHLNRILEHAPLGMLMINQQRNVVALNQRARLILGVEPGQIIDKPVFSLLPVFAQKKLRRMLAEVNADSDSDAAGQDQGRNGSARDPKNGAPVIVPIGEDPDNIRHVELIVAGPATDSDEAATMLILHDVTGIVRAQQAQRAAAAALQASEDRFHEIAEVMRMVPWEADPATMVVTYIGDLAEELAGFPAERWLDKSFVLERIHPDDLERVRQVMRRNCQRLQNFDFGFRVFAANGETLWLRNIVNVVRSADGTLEKVRGFILDVSETQQGRDESSG